MSHPVVLCRLWILLHLGIAIHSCWFLPAGLGQLICWEWVSFWMFRTTLMSCISWLMDASCFVCRSTLGRHGTRPTLCSHFLWSFGALVWFQTTWHRKVLLYHTLLQATFFTFHPHSVWFGWVRAALERFLERFQNSYCLKNLTEQLMCPKTDGG